MGERDLLDQRVSKLNVQTYYLGYKIMIIKWEHIKVLEEGLAQEMLSI